jgi:hypothetical protein
VIAKIPAAAIAAAPSAVLPQRLKLVKTHLLAGKLFANDTTGSISSDIGFARFAAGPLASVSPASHRVLAISQLRRRRVERPIPVC